VAAQETLLVMKLAPRLTKKGPRGESYYATFDLLTCIHYAMRDGHVRSMADRSAGNHPL
jgi:hypothetical protein